MKTFIMALNLICNFFFVTAPDPSGFPTWVARTKLKTYYDSTANAVVTKLTDASDVVIDSNVKFGPNLYAGALSLNVRVQDNHFQYCTGTTLNWYTLDLNTFPYVILNQAPNSNVCQTLVCDLAIINVDTTPATGALNQDGGAAVNATTSHGVMKYKLNAVDFDYAATGGDSAGQASNIFAALLPGSYTYCVKDAVSCKKTGTFLIGNSDTYVERWKSDFRDVKTGNMHRISIEDRLFVGTSTMIKMDIAAAQLAWRGEATEDSFVPVVAAEMRVALFSETDGQFVDLFTGDERRFKLKKYINTGSGFVLQWVGFITPMLYSEPYTESTNYPVNITANDQLGNLSNLQFSTDQELPFTSRISYMTAITTILRKTGLQLNLRESVNMFETTMAQTATDSMLTQCTIDPDTYKNTADGTFLDCLTVLKSLVQNIGSRLYQDDGIWKLDFIEQKSATSIAYRMFSYLGLYLSNGTYDPTINFGTSVITNRIVPYDSSVFMNITQNYGSFSFINNLHIVNNFLRGGDMEAIDNTGTNPTLKGWSVDVSDGPGISFGLEKLDKDNRGSRFAAVFDFRNSPAGSSVVLQSDPFIYTVSTLAKFKLIFDVYTRPVYTDTYIFLDYEVTMGSEILPNEGYASDGVRRMSSTGTGLLLDGPTIGHGVPEYNRVYITEHLTWKTVQIEFYGSDIDLAGNGYVKLRIQGNPAFDYSGLAGALPALPGAVTIDGRLQTQAPKARVLDTTVLRWYTLNAGNDATSSPDKIRPTDWSAGVPVFWKLDKTTAPLQLTNWLQNILIDNVQMVYLPDGEPPVENITYDQTTNPNIKNTLTRSFNHGDIPVLDPNYKYISKGHLQLLNGTPTVNWKRTYVSTDSSPLVQLIQFMHMGQFQTPKFKLSGTFGFDLPVSFANTFYELRTRKRYLPNAITMNYADSSMVIEMLELKQGTASPAPDLFAFSLGFSTGFNA